MTLADLVRRDYRFSPIFERFELDYCCKGSRTLAQACAEIGLDKENVLTEMARIPDEPVPLQPLPNAGLEEVLNLLYHTHGPKLQAMLLPAEAKLRKVAGSHGEAFPQTTAAAEVMDQLTDELLPHLSRGKEVLLPRVNETLKLRDRGEEEVQASKSRFSHLTHQLIAENRVMQRYLSEIRELTSRYKVPEGVCVTFSVGYRELAAVDEALSQFLAIEQEVLSTRLRAEPSTW